MGDGSQVNLLNPPQQLCQVVFLEICLKNGEKSEMIAKQNNTRCMATERHHWNRGAFRLDAFAGALALDLARGTPWSRKLVSCQFKAPAWQA